MPSCAAFGCTNRPERKIPGITFHKFPKRQQLREAWIYACKRKNWMPSDSSLLCNEHFSEDQIDRSSLMYVRLRENAVPNIFKAFPPYLQKLLEKRKSRKKRSTISDSSVGMQALALPLPPADEEKGFHQLETCIEDSVVTSASDFNTNTEPNDSVSPSENNKSAKVHAAAKSPIVILLEDSVVTSASDFNTNTEPNDSVSPSENNKSAKVHAAAKSPIVILLEDSVVTSASDFNTNTEPNHSVSPSENNKSAKVHAAAAKSPIEALLEDSVVTSASDFNTNTEPNHSVSPSENNKSAKVHAAAAKSPIEALLEDSVVTSASDFNTNTEPNHSVSPSENNKSAKVHAVAAKSPIKLLLIENPNINSLKQKINDNNNLILEYRKKIRLLQQQNRRCYQKLNKLYNNQ